MSDDPFHEEGEDKAFNPFAKGEHCAFAGGTSNSALTFHILNRERKVPYNNRFPALTPRTPFPICCLLCIAGVVCHSNPPGSPHHTSPLSYLFKVVAVWWRVVAREQRVVQVPDGGGGGEMAGRTCMCVQPRTCNGRQHLFTTQQQRVYMSNAIDDRDIASLEV